MKIKLLLAVAGLLVAGCTEYKENIRPVSRDKASEAVTEVLTGQGDNSEKGQGAGGDRNNP